MLNLLLCLKINKLVSQKGLELKLIFLKKLLFQFYILTFRSFIILKEK